MSIPAPALRLLSRPAAVAPQVLLVLGLAYGALRSSALSQATTTPLFRMVVGLGLACGALGYVAVGKLGGNADVWLLYWEVRCCIDTCVACLVISQWSIGAGQRAVMENSTERSSATCASTLSALPSNVVAECMHGVKSTGAAVREQRDVAAGMDRAAEPARVVRR